MAIALTEKSHKYIHKQTQELTDELFTITALLSSIKQLHSFLLASLKSSNTICQLELEIERNIRQSFTLKIFVNLEFRLIILFIQEETGEIVGRSPLN